MSVNAKARGLGLAAGLFCAAIGVASQPANAVPVNLDVWYEFGFNGPGTSLTDGSGLVPATNPPDGNPIVQVGDPAWTITTTGTTRLTVLDLFNSVDQFEMFDNAVNLGLTSAAVDGGTCNSDITCALADLRYSRGEFILAAGDHSLTGAQTLGIPGAAVFILTQVDAVPEPATLGLLATGLAGFGLFRRRKSRQAAS